jgi:hypothetical protein
MSVSNPEEDYDEPPSASREIQMNAASSAAADPPTVAPAAPTDSIAPNAPADTPLAEDDYAAEAEIVPAPPTAPIAVAVAATTAPAEPDEYDEGPSGGATQRSMIGDIPAAVDPTLQLPLPAVDAPATGPTDDYDDAGEPSARSAGALASARPPAAGPVVAASAQASARSTKAVTPRDPASLLGEPDATDAIDATDATSAEPLPMAAELPVAGDVPVSISIATTTEESGAIAGVDEAPRSPTPEPQSQAIEPVGYDEAGEAVALPDGRMEIGIQTVLRGQHLLLGALGYREEEVRWGGGE